MISVGYVISEYLPYSQTFIYNEITHLKRFNPIVLYHTLQNTHIFSLDSLVNLKEGPWKLDFRYEITLSTPYDSIKKLKHYVVAHRYYKKLLKKYNIHLLHAQFGPEGVHTLPIKSSFSLPLITSFRGYDLYMELKKNPGIYDKLFQAGDLFLFRSNSMLEDAVELGFPREKCRVQHSSLQLEKFPFRERKPVKKNELVKILFVGRFVEKKNPIGTVEIFSQIKSKYENVRLTMIGDGPLLENARRRIEERGLSQSIELLGYQPHNKVIEEMLDSHIFFMPFKTAPDGDKEGIPNSVKEASATGLPVVSTFHSGVPEAVLDGKTGLLADEEEEDALVGKLSYLIENQDVWSIFGKAGRELMEKEFDIIKETEKLEGFYSKLLA